MVSKMNRVLIKRFETSDQGTFGKLYAPNFSCFIGEPPWRDNQTNISCIPIGEYHVKLVKSSRFGIIKYSNTHKVVYWILNVSNRTGVLQHSGNFCGDRSLGLKSHTYGCQLLGKSFSTINGQKAVLNSGPTLRKFMEIMNYENYILEIKEG